MDKSLRVLFLLACLLVPSQFNSHLKICFHFKIILTPWSWTYSSVSPSSSWSSSSVPSSLFASGSLCSSPASSVSSRWRGIHLRSQILFNHIGCGVCEKHPSRLFLGFPEKYQLAMLPKKITSPKYVNGRIYTSFLRPDKIWSWVGESDQNWPCFKRGYLITH